MGKGWRGIKTGQVRGHQGGIAKIMYGTQFRHGGFFSSLIQGLDHSRGSRFTLRSFIPHDTPPSPVGMASVYPRLVGAMSLGVGDAWCGGGIYRTLSGQEIRLGIEARNPVEHVGNSELLGTLLVRARMR